MNSYSNLLISLLLSASLMAQESDKTLYALSTATQRAGISYVSIADPYLSSLQYSGWGATIEWTEQRFLNPQTRLFSVVNRLTGLAAQTYNPAQTATINMMHGNYSWGMLYNYRYFNTLVLLAGTTAQADFGFKANSRNVNNPYNMDLAISLNAVLGARYSLETRKRTIDFTSGFESPIAGVMFVPYPGLSYYEMYTSGKYSEAVFLSSLHNRQGAKLSFAVDIPFRRSTLHMAYRFHQLNYKGSGPVFRFSENALMLGITYDVFRTSGRSMRFPGNFIRF
jgi:hypothetical protein